MGLFKKKNKVENIEPNKEANSTSSNQKTDGIEVLDFAEEDKKTEAANKIERKKENRLLFIILIGLVVLVLLLPKITSLFNKKSIFSYSDEVKDIEEQETINGMLEIGSETGSITAKKIKFYNFIKKSDNTIDFIYLPQSGIKNPNELNIFIELYNSKQNIIYRTKFVHDSKLERKVQGTYTLTINSTLYSEAKYAKVVIIESKDIKEAIEEYINENKGKGEEYINNYKKNIKEQLDKLGINY